MLIKKENVSLERVSKLYPRQNNLVRIVDIKTSSGVFKRSVTRLASLFSEENNIQRSLDATIRAEHSDEVHVQRKKGNPLPVPVILTLMLLFPLAISKPIKVTEFSNKTGIFYDRLGTKRIVVSGYYDLSTTQF